MKDIERNVDYHKLRKDQAEECREDQRRQSERKNNLETEIQQLQDSKIQLEAKLQKSMDQYNQSTKIKAEIQNKKTRMEELERNRRDLESDITNILTVGVEELEHEILKFQQTKV